MNKILSFLVLTILVSVAAFGAVSCSSYSSSSTNPHPAQTSPAAGQTPGGDYQPGKTADVTIQNFAFSPATLTVAVGTTVTWHNNDSPTHTVVSDSGVFSSGDLPTGSTFSFTFSATGTFSYHCGIHPSMKGTVTVQ